MTRSKDASNGPEGKHSEMLRKKATSSKGRMHQPKGSMNSQHSKATRMAKKEKNPDSKAEAMREMEF